MSGPVSRNSEFQPEFQNEFQPEPKYCLAQEVILSCKIKKTLRTPLIFNSIKLQ